MKERVYVLKYVVITATSRDEKTAYFDFSERQRFIEEYFRLKDAWYIEDLKSYYAELENVNVEIIADAI